MPERKLERKFLLEINKRKFSAPNLIVIYELLLKIIRLQELIARDRALRIPDRIKRQIKLILTDKNRINCYNDEGLTDLAAALSILSQELDQIINDNEQDNEQDNDTNSK